MQYENCYRGDDGRFYSHVPFEVTIRTEALLATHTKEEMDKLYENDPRMLADFKEAIQADHIRIVPEAILLDTLKVLPVSSDEEIAMSERSER